MLVIHYTGVCSSGVIFSLICSELKFTASDVIANMDKAILLCVGEL